MNVSLEIRPIPPEELARNLAVPDLTDPANGIHAVNLVLSRIVEKLKEAPGSPTPELHRMPSVVSVADNFDRLYFPNGNLSRSSVYARYVDHGHLLRTHTSAAIPELLRGNTAADRLLVCPGICFRRDVADRTHCGEPHQVDIWRVRQGAPFLRREALISLIETVLSATFPGAKYRANETEHPYTVCGLEVEVQIGDHWLEILECGEVNPRILLDAGLPPSEWSGLAMGIGLDRLVMITKSIDDIRLLRAMDKRIARQMTDLEPYIPVSKYPSIRHDLSVAVDEATQPEDVAEVVRGALGRDCDVLEEVVIVSETKYADLHPAAIERLGMSPSQKNLLVRITFRSHERSLVQGEANVFRDRVYDALHKGSKKLYASR